MKPTFPLGGCEINPRKKRNYTARNRSRLYRLLKTDIWRFYVTLVANIVQNDMGKDLRLVIYFLCRLRQVPIVRDTKSRL